MSQESSSQESSRRRRASESRISEKSHNKTVEKTPRKKRFSLKKTTKNLFGKTGKSAEKNTVKNQSESVYEEMSISRFSVRLIISICTWILIGSIGTLLALLVVVPRTFGWVPLTILSSSMEPSYPVGAQVIVKPLSIEEAKNVQVNEVITFLPFPDDPTTVTHRIHSRDIRPDGEVEFRTKGDNVKQIDDWVITPKMIRGRAMYMVPYAGYVVNWIGEERQNLLISGFIVLTILYACYQFWASAREKKRNKKMMEKGGIAAAQHVLEQLKQSDPVVFEAINELSGQMNEAHNEGADGAAEEFTTSDSKELAVLLAYAQKEENAQEAHPEDSNEEPQLENNEAQTLSMPPLPSTQNSLNTMKKYDMLSVEDIDQVQKEVQNSLDRGSVDEEFFMPDAGESETCTAEKSKEKDPNSAPEFLSPKDYQIELNAQIEELLQRVERDKTEAAPVRKEVHGFFNRRRQDKERARQLERLREELLIEALKARTLENERLAEEARKRRLMWEQNAAPAVSQPQSVTPSLTPPAVQPVSQMQLLQESAADTASGPAAGSATGQTNIETTGTASQGSYTHTAGGTVSGNTVPGNTAPPQPPPVSPPPYSQPYPAVPYPAVPYTSAPYQQAQYTPVPYPAYYPPAFGGGAPYAHATYMPYPAPYPPYPPYPPAYGAHYPELPIQPYGYPHGQPYKEEREDSTTQAADNSNSKENARPAAQRANPEKHTNPENRQETTPTHQPYGYGSYAPYGGYVQDPAYPHAYNPYYPAPAYGHAYGHAYGTYPSPDAQMSKDNSGDVNQRSDINQQMQTQKETQKPTQDLKQENVYGSTGSTDSAHYADHEADHYADHENAQENTQSASEHFPTKKTQTDQDSGAYSHREDKSFTHLGLRVVGNDTEAQ